MNGIAAWKPEKGLDGYDRAAVAIVKDENGNLLFHHRSAEAKITPNQIIFWGGSPDKFIHSPEDTILGKIKNKLGVEINRQHLQTIGPFQKLKKYHGVDGKIFVFSIRIISTQLTLKEGRLFSAPEDLIRQCVVLDNPPGEIPSECLVLLAEFSKFSLLTREVLKFIYGPKSRA
ncbi:MAG TPA: hypothetical protein PK526_02915 [bacterium]|nr:hypothetical protein [bacterium]